MATTDISRSLVRLRLRGSIFFRCCIKLYTAGAVGGGARGGGVVFVGVWLVVVLVVLGWWSFHGLGRRVCDCPHGIAFVV
jgi:hypothetical protein